jgi:hypothetical protein
MSSCQKELVATVVSTERISGKTCSRTEISKVEVKILFSTPTQTFYFSLFILSLAFT